MADPATTPVVHAEVEKNLAEAERDRALDLAAVEHVNHVVAQTRAVDAEIEAQHNLAAAREMTTERNLLRENLAAEQHSSASNAFGFYLMTGILLAILLVGGIYYYFHRQDQVAAGNAGGTINVSSAPPPPAVSPTVITPPPVVHINPPPVRNEIKVVPPTAPPEGNASPSPNSTTDNAGGATDRTDQNR